MYLIAGATGYVGGLLADRLVTDGKAVRCLARSPERASETLDPRCEIVRGDVLEPSTLGPALEGVEAAYYLVHSMGRGGDGDFAERDRRGARNFAEAAAAAGVERIIYLGGLGEGTVDAPEVAPGDRRAAGLDRHPAHLLPRGDRDRFRQRVAAHDRLPGPPAAGDGDPELDDHQDPADRRRRRRRLPGRGRRMSRSRPGARSRSAATRSPPTAACSTSAPRRRACGPGSASPCRCSRRP